MKKFLLVPPTQLPSPLVRKLSQLDEEMKTILDRTDLSDFDKAQLYSSVLDKYIEIKNKLARPQPIPIVEQPSQPNTKPDVELSLFPKTYRPRAQNLLNHVRNNTDLVWNDRGELLVDGQPIPGSHIVDLVDDIVRQRQGPKPIGSDTFVRSLRGSNVPQAFVGNKNRFTGRNTSVENPLRDVSLGSSSTPSRHSRRGRRAQRGRGAKIMRWETL